MKLLVTGAWKATTAQLQTLREMGHELVLQQQESQPLPCPYEEIEGTICNGLFLHHPIEKFTRLRYIQLTSAGLDRVPLVFISKHNIKLMNARGVYSAPMAECALSGVLQLYKQASFFQKNQRDHLWMKHKELQELTGRTVLILGCGSVGTECAKRFSAFDCKVIGIDLVVHESPYFHEIYHLRDLNNLLRTADMIVLTLPLTEDTRHLFNESRLALCNPSAILVNIARGAIIDQKALVNHASQLGGLVLDVFEEEPLPADSPLWDAPNAIITPHNSYVGNLTAQRLANLILRNLRAFSG